MLQHERKEDQTAMRNDDRKDKGMERHMLERWAGHKGKKGIKRKKWHCSSNFEAHVQVTE
jgi:hypothetical protein